VKRAHCTKRTGKPRTCGLEKKTPPLLPPDGVAGRNSPAGGDDRGKWENSDAGNHIAQQPMPHIVPGVLDPDLPEHRRERPLVI